MKRKRKGIIPRPRANTIDVSRRIPTEDAGPTLQTMLQAAWRQGQGVYTDLRTRKLSITGNYRAADNALDLFRARGWLSDGQIMAGHRYSSFHRIVYGSPVASISSLMRWIRPEGGFTPSTTEDEHLSFLERCQKELDHGDNAISVPPAAMRLWVRRVCIDGTEPTTNQEFDYLSRGLNLLMRAWHIRLA